MDNEERQLRNLDKLRYMSEYIKEDNISTQQSLSDAQQIRDQSKQEMEMYEESESRELDALQQEIKKLDQLVRAQEQRQSEVKAENERIQKSINLGRQQDKNTNAQ